MERTQRVFSQSEGRKMKRKVEMLRKESHQDFLQMMTAAHTPQSPLAASHAHPVSPVDSLLIQGSAGQVHPFEIARRKSNRPQIRTPLLSPRSPLPAPPHPLFSNISRSPLEFNAELLKSPPASAGLPQTPLAPPEVYVNRGEREQFSLEKGLRSLVKESVDSSTLGISVQKTIHTPAQKPAIAHVAGTTKVISMSQRPQPPSKPRSQCLPSSLRVSTHKHRNNMEPNQVSGLVRKQADRRARRSSFPRVGQAPNSDSSEDSSEDSGSDCSGGSAQRRARRRKKKKRRQRDGSPSQRKEPEDSQIHGGLKIHDAKSSTELLLEAQSIAGMLMSEDQSVDNSASESQQGETEIVIARDSGRTVDEIIASLQQGSGVPSASDRMIKQLMTKVLGDCSSPELSEEEELVPESEESVVVEVPVESSPVQHMEETSPVIPDFYRKRVWAKKERVNLRPIQYSAVPPGKYKMDDTKPVQEASLDATSLSTEVSYADIVAVKGEAKAQVQRPRRGPLLCKPIQDLSLLATWAPKNNMAEHKTIHHLCTTPASQVLPVELQLASRVCHTINKLSAPPQFYQQREALQHIATHPDRHRILTEGLPCVSVPEATEVSVTEPSPAGPSDLADWQRIAEYYVEKPRMLLEGHAMSLCSNELKMFWSPAPPKFSFAPAFVRHKLFPKYQATRPDLSSEELYDDLQVLSVTSPNDTAMDSSMTTGNVLSRKCTSLNDLTIAEQTGKTSTERRSKRPHSAPTLHPDCEGTLKVRCDYSAITRELQAVKQQLSSAIPASEPPADSQPQSVSTGQQQADIQPPLNQLPTDQETTVGSSPTLGSLHQRQKQPRKGQRGRVQCVNSPHAKKKTIKGKKLSPAKLSYVLQKFNGESKETPRQLTRSESLFSLLSKPSPKPPEETPPLSLPPRVSSVPLLLNFAEFSKARGGIPETVLHREWVRDIWEVWFDELFPPLEESSGPKKDEAKKGAGLQASGALEAQRKPEEKGLTEDEMRNLDRVDLSLTLDEGLTTADLESEVASLTQALAEPQYGKLCPFHLCRRGALHKKLGRLNQAMDDLNAAIALEPTLLNAYWHRHSIHLLRNNQNSALEDLNSVIKLNKKHADSFKSKAEIYRAKGDSTLAIISYTQAIKCNPQDDDSYFKRAQMYEKRNEIYLAMEDYAKTFSINPGRIDALMIHGLQYFKTGNWMVALSDFTLMLQHEPGLAKARTYRARIYSKIGQYQEAIEDFSVAVHLEPNNWLAFYHRGCLLQIRMPDMALRDLSTSVLINNSKENLNAFLHRGLLYTQRKQWQQAVSDFEAVIKLDRTVAVAHVNLGLIYMLKMNMSSEAVAMFSNALRADPTYIRAYICRAQAHRNSNDLKNALKDLTRAIHMKPDAQQLYIMRGQFLCDMGRFDLATFCIKYASEMKQALGFSPIQQAAVQSFLGNDAKAIACLEAATNTRPSPPILILLGKTEMKARMFTEAVESFKKALILLSPDETNLCNVTEAAEVFYLIGLCYMTMVQLQQALDAFSNAVKINPDYADAYHQRGLCRMRLQQSKSVQDFNKALCINPKHFQVYLSRAAFYGAKGRYSKAILNCNEAISIQPKSIRAYLYRGALKFYLKAYKGAAQDLTMAIKIDSSCSFAFYNRGVCYQQLREYELALKDYGIVLLLPSKKEIDLKVLINRALLYVELADHHNALMDFRAASEKSSKDATIHHALGVYYHRLGHLEESVNAFSLALKLKPFFLEAYVGRGGAYMDFGHAQAHKQAQRDFLSALHLDPLCSNARISLAYNFQVFGCFQRAWNQFTVAMDINPGSFLALEGRAVVSLQMGDTYAAFQDINMALKYHSNSEQLLTNRGVINQFMNDRVNAMRDYHEAIHQNPSYSLAYFNAANLYFYNRQFEQACEYYSRGLDLDPKDECAVLNRAITRTLLRKVPEALQDFALALELNPYSSHVHFNRANLYCSLHKYSLAEEDLTRALELHPGDALVYKLRADVRGHLGWTEQAVQDYRTAVELQEALEGY